MANIGYLQLVRHCNQYCWFCSNPASGWTLDLDTALRAVDDFAERGYFGVILTGGEPSLSPIVADVARHAAARGLHVRMITNGSRLGQEGVAAAYVEAGLRHFHVSIHTCREPLEDFITGVRGSFALAMGALEALGRAGATVNVNTVINKRNADHLD